MDNDMPLGKRYYYPYHQFQFGYDTPQTIVSHRIRINP